MYKTGLGLVLVASWLVACGGGNQAAGGPETHAPPPGPAAPPTTAPPLQTGEPAPAPAKLTLPDLQKKSLADSLAAWAGHDAGKLAKLYTDDVTFAYPSMDGMRETHGRADLEKNMDAFFKAFPDVKIGRVRTLVTGDVVTLEWIVAGTQTGDFMGMKPTNKKVGYRGLSILWFGDDGLVKAEHMYMDHGTFMAQLGVAPKGMKGRAFMDVPADLKTEWVASTGSDVEKKDNETATTFFNTFVKHDEKGFLDLLNDDAVHSDYSQPDDAAGKDAGKKEFEAFTKALPDIKATVKNLWAAGDYVMAEVEWSGTLKGALGPMKPTNKSGTFHSGEIVQFKNGKVSHDWTYGSGAEFAAAFGLMPKETPKPTTNVKAAPPTGAPKAGPAPATPKAGTAPVAPKAGTAPVAPPAPKPAAPKPGTSVKQAPPTSPPATK